MSDAKGSRMSGKPVPKAVTIAKIMLFIKRLSDEGFYGTLSLTFRKGRIVGPVRQSQTIKLEDGDGPVPSD